MPPDMDDAPLQSAMIALGIERLEPPPATFSSRLRAPVGHLLLWFIRAAHESRARAALPMTAAARGAR